MTVNTLGDYAVLPFTRSLSCLEPNRFIVLMHVTIQRFIHVKIILLLRNSSFAIIPDYERPTLVFRAVSFLFYVTLLWWSGTLKYRFFLFKYSSQVISRLEECRGMYAEFWRWKNCEMVSRCPNRTFNWDIQLYHRCQKILGGGRFI